MLSVPILLHEWPWPPVHQYWCSGMRLVLWWFLSLFFVRFKFSDKYHPLNWLHWWRCFLFFELPPLFPSICSCSFIDPPVSFFLLGTSGNPRPSTFSPSWGMPFSWTWRLRGRVFSVSTGTLNLFPSSCISSFLSLESTVSLCGVSPMRPLTQSIGTCIVGYGPIPTPFIEAFSFGKYFGRMVFLCRYWWFVVVFH